MQTQPHGKGPPEAALSGVRGWWLWAGADSALPQLLEMKSTDRKQTLLHYLVRVIMEKYPELTGFHTELHFLDKAGTGTAHGPWAGGRGSPWHWEPALTLHCPSPTVSLEGVLQDVRSLQQGMELTRREFMRQDDSPVLKDFLKVNSEVMEKLQADSKTAKVGAGVGGVMGAVPCMGTPWGALCSHLCPMGDGSAWDVAAVGQDGGIWGRMGRWGRLEGGG